jgi:lycopene cyclase domain-containing protein
MRESTMLKLSYLVMLIFTMFASFWLEIAFKVHVLRRMKRVLLSLLPISLGFLIWDAYAIAQGHWYFDQKQVTGINGPFNIPIEEILFFLIIPIAVLMTLEGVARIKPQWKHPELRK